MNIQGSPLPSRTHNHQPPSLVFLRLSSLLLTLLFVLSPATGAWAENCVDYDADSELIGSLGIAGISDLVVQDSLAYALDAQGLLILELSQPTQPQQLGSLILSGPGSQLAISGSHALILDSAGIQSVDISNPTAPTLVGQAAFPEGFGLAAGNGFACVTHDGGVTFFDLTDPANPSQAGTWSGPDTFFGAACLGNSVFACGTNSLYALDAGTLSAPTTLAHISLSIVSQNPQLIGSRLFAPGYGGLAIIDVTDPATLWPRTMLDSLTGQVTGVTVSDNYLLVADGADDTHLYTLDGTVPTSVADLPFNTDLLATGPSAGLVTATLSDERVGMIKLGGDSLQSLIGNLPLNDSVQEIFPAGDQLYVRQGTVLTRLDLSDGDTPSVIESGNLGTYLALSRNGKFAYVNAGSGLEVYDISTLSSPLLVGQLPLDSFPGPIAVADNVVYLTRANMDNITVAVDVSDPASPAQLGATGAGSEHNFRKVHGTSIFEGRRAALWIADVSTPGVFAHWTPAGPSNAQDVAFAADRAYAVGSGYLSPSQVCVLDISDPTAPVTIDCFEPGGNCVAVVGHRLYVGTNSGLSIYDLTDPDLPTFIGGLESGPSSHDLAVVSDRVYLASGASGLSIAARQCDEPLLPLPFEEDFNAGIADGFYALTGDWQVQDGSYHCLNSTPGHKDFASVGDFAWGDVHMEVDTQAHGTAMHEVALRYNPGGDAYLVTFRRSPWNDAFLHKVVGGVQTQLVHVENLSFGPGPWHHIEIDAVGSRITAAIDGQTAFTYNDEATPLLQGRVALVSLALGQDGWQDAWFDNIVVSENTASSTPPSSGIQRSALLLPPYPNPFNPQVEISFVLERTSPVELAVYDISGRYVAKLTQQVFDPGQHTLTWDGRDPARREMPSGIYLVHLRTPDAVDVRRVALIR